VTAVVKQLFCRANKCETATEAPTESSTEYYDYYSDELIQQFAFMATAIYQFTVSLSQLMLRGVGLFALITNGLSLITFVSMRRKKQQVSTFCRLYPCCYIFIFISHKSSKANTSKQANK